MESWNHWKFDLLDNSKFHSDHPHLHHFTHLTQLRKTVFKFSRAEDPPLQTKWIFQVKKTEEKLWFLSSSKQESRQCCERDPRNSTIRGKRQTLKKFNISYESKKSQQKRGNRINQLAYAQLTGACVPHLPNSVQEIRSSFYWLKSIFKRKEVIDLEIDHDNIRSCKWNEIKTCKPYCLTKSLLKIKIRNMNKFTHRLTKKK